MTPAGMVGGHQVIRRDQLPQSSGYRKKPQKENNLIIQGGEELDGDHVRTDDPEDIHTS
jgi:hypothetical protein